MLSTRSVATRLLLLSSSTGLPCRAAAAAPLAQAAALRQPQQPPRCLSTASPTAPSLATTGSPRSRSLRSSVRTMSAAAGTAVAGAGVLEIERVHCLSDNYAWLLHEPQQGVTAVVDPSECAPVVAALERKGWKLTHILNTHHHWDHTGGNEELKAKYGVTIVGPAADAARIPEIDVELKDGDRYQLGAAESECFDTPGHTRGHVTFHFPASKALFPGDTLFSLGCGRLFEGTPAQMWGSLSKMTPLPGDTRVFCAHEYTESNARFAVHLDGDNEDLKRMSAEITAKRAQQEPTVPSMLSDELKCNPFLRPDSPAIRASLGIPPGASNEEAFAAIRAAKDTFR